MLGSYLARFGVTVARSVLRPRLHPLDEVRMPMRVWPSDVDVYGHLNNGRLLTLLDFGRLQYGARVGWLRTGLERGWRPVLAAQTVRYRRELRLLSAFEQVCRLCHWDRKFLYFEQRLERGGDLHAVAYVQVVTKLRGGWVAPAEMLATLDFASDPPPAPRELSDWIHAIVPLRAATTPSATAH